MVLRCVDVAGSRGGNVLFSGIGFAVEPGQGVRIHGDNGSGKTTLLRMLAGLTPPHAGAVLWEDEDIRTARQRYCANLLYLGHAPGVKNELLAWENLVFMQGLRGRAAEDEARACLAEAGLGAQADLPAGALSQGQRKRLALARLQLAHNRPMWLLDEPFVGLDQDAVAALCDRVASHRKAGGMLVYTTHQAVEVPDALTLRLEAC
ncbi:heme exporter protein A [Pseudoduganella flava]|uniref:Cytochrome c biogenesis heme-transporting ATPase CcmA n=1 Tax=Pseudoduganella flava TaxID=871742 RepID=A0A562PNX2_9BURK|nr:cytochrome c biogenesis heme-transporting ATPase CcmA [Pseudoduganella flava]QGZ40656.1 cytochrome c biogenesis heme-transporting ATPase CcmA [Pseudoduganella flava]TWI46109.1 heme exporter protein A [Pseudoduganella flava]